MADKKELEQLNREELRDRARDQDVSGYSDMKKAELVDALVKEERKSRSGKQSSKQSGSKGGSQSKSQSSQGKGSQSGQGKGSQSSQGKESQSGQGKGSQSGQSDRSQSSQGQGSQSAQGDGKLGAAQIASRARRQLAELTDKPIEGVLTVEPSDDGWLIVMEVTELHRIPDSTDVLAAYETTVSAEGELLSYKRTSRYLRAQSD